MTTFLQSVFTAVESLDEKFGKILYKCLKLWIKVWPRPCFIYLRRQPKFNMKKTGFIILIFSGFFLNLLCLGLAFAQVSAPISNQDRASVETLRLIEPVPYPISDQ
ncbi:MAG: hypothetical protein AABZ55_03305, partial [Bdellovibrionota bacterium]